MNGDGAAHDLQVSDYVYLHNHTHHSLLDGLTKIDELVDTVKEYGMEASAITDHGTLSGAIDYYKAAKKKGIKPIIGIEAYIAARTRHDRDPSKDKARYHLIILAMNHTGWQNLMQLSSIANLEGVYYKARMDREILEKYNEGLIVLSACAGGEVGEALRYDDYEKAKEIASWYKSVFGDRYYLELQDHGHPNAPAPWDVQIKINEQVEKLGQELGIERVVTTDAHYVGHGDQEAHEILLCVGTGAYLSDEKRMSLKDFELHLTDPKDIIERWGPTNPQAVRNSKVIADRCNLEIELGKILIPKYPVPDGYTERSYLHTLVYRGLLDRYNGVAVEETEKLSIEQIQPQLSKEVLERVEMELGVLSNMGYEGYFLIVQDFINWGKRRNIVFGPGRGSAAGAIIAYALHITDLDPLKYELLFERFLNPDRISMPDIDVDIQDTRRDEVIEYCSQKYGAERVSNIVTFGKMAARAAVRDVARVLQVPYSDADRLAKLVPQAIQGRHIPLKVSTVEDPDLKKEYNENPTSKRVLDFAKRLEGTIRSHGVHACGVVIAPDDLVKYIPLEQAQKGVVSTQFPMNEVEELGLLKMDFLGLSNLTIINNCMRIIKKVYGVSIDLPNLPLDDVKAYELFQRGDTTGVFQLESAGMKRYLRGLKPSVFEDIIAMVALYRPGPMQFIDSFIRRKHGEEKITYLHPGMENSLKNTYGILVYQEQFMKISKEWCGFTGGQADTLRKAVGKKKIDLMKKVKPEFVEGAIKHGGATKEIAETFWEQLEEFANYCFNKSHAACYGLIAYWTAYLKAHYPDAFMAALMTSDEDDTDRLAIEMTECKHMGIEVLSPDVNESFVEFAVVPNKNQIRFGMAAIKGVGTGAVEDILKERENGRFASIEDFVKRMAGGRINRKVWESLIKTGAFDSLTDRSTLLYNLDDILAYGQRIAKEASSGQAGLFDALSEDEAEAVQVKLDLKEAPVKYTEREQLVWERELMGLYVSAHPLDHYSAYFEEQAIPLSAVTPNIDGHELAIGGLISTVRTILTKSNSKMAFVGIEDMSGEAEVIVFPRTYEEIGDKLVQDAVIRVTGKISARDREGNLGDEAKMIANEIEFVTDRELDQYQSTGEKMEVPTMRAAYRKKVRRSASADKDAPDTPKKNYGAGPKKYQRKVTNVDAKQPSKPAGPPPKPLIDDRILYLNVPDANDTDTLLAIKQLCNKHRGQTEVIMVLGADKSSAIRMPFKIESSRALLDGLSEVLSAEGVVLK